MVAVGSVSSASETVQAPTEASKAMAALPSVLASDTPVANVLQDVLKTEVLMFLAKLEAHSASERDIMSHATSTMNVLMHFHLLGRPANEIITDGQTE